VEWEKKWGTSRLTPHFPKQVVASDEIKQQILKTGIRKLERETRVSHHTLEKVLKGETIRRKTLAKVVKLLQGT
jgi:predicted transcriptional regulator